VRVIGLSGASDRRLVHHQVPAARLHGALEFFHSFDELNQGVRWIGIVDCDAERAQPMTDLLSDSRDIGIPRF
jgi:hypothetical protein